MVQPPRRNLRDLTAPAVDDDAPCNAQAVLPADALEALQRLATGNAPPPLPEAYQHMRDWLFSVMRMRWQYDPWERRVSIATPYPYRGDFVARTGVPVQAMEQLQSPRTPGELIAGAPLLYDAFSVLLEYTQQFGSASYSAPHSATEHGMYVIRRLLSDVLAAVSGNLTERPQTGENHGRGNHVQTDSESTHVR